MTANDLLSAGYFDQWMRALHAAIQQQQAAAVATGGEVVLYSVAKLAAVLDVHPETVRTWLRTGKRGRDGQVIKLRAFEFTTEKRIPWPALLAYHRGEDFDLNSLPAPLLLPPAELLPAPLPKLTDPTMPPGVLRVA